MSEDILVGYSGVGDGGREEGRVSIRAMGSYLRTYVVPAKAGPFGLSVVLGADKA